jgi:hypothetical protein
VQLIYLHVQQAIRDYKYNKAGLLVSAQHHPIENLYEAGAATKKACKNVCCCNVWSITERVKIMLIFSSVIAYGFVTMVVHSEVDGVHQVVCCTTSFYSFYNCTST